MCDCKAGETRERIWTKARKQSGLPTDSSDQTFDSYHRDLQPHALDAARDFATDPDLWWLLMKGRPGTGKSHLLVAIANALLPARRPLYFIAPDLLDYLRAGMRDGDDDNETAIARTKRVSTCDVLLIDDYGAENTTPWADERMYQIIDHRYRYRLPLVLATNLAEDKMPPRIASRLHDTARSRVINMTPGDYRRSDRRADELRALLDDLDATRQIAAD